MFALIYLVLAVLLGDTIGRRFVRYSSLPHRLASAFLVGLVLSTWTTYLAARVFASSTRPLFFGNAIFFLVATGTIYWLRKRGTQKPLESDRPAEVVAENKWDWATIAVLFVFSCWLMFSSLNMQAGKLQIANHQWSDFGPNIALMQSFAVGRNFPTEYPHFAGDRIRYHFLFYFQAGNLEYLGLNPAWANNLLSILSLISMLVLVMELGYVVFGSRVVGRIGAVLFLFSGSLAYIPFLRSKDSLGSAIKAATELASFLPSQFSYRGEDWGMWSLVNFLNQRHFASAIGILLLVLVFLCERYRKHSAAEKIYIPDAALESQKPTLLDRFNTGLYQNRSFIFFGAILGLLPLWNGAVFLAAAVMLVFLVVLFPLRKQTTALLLTASVVALPQVAYLRTGNVHPAAYSLFHWGYTIDNPTIWNVLKYLGFTFGFKWLLIGIACAWLGWFQRRLLIAITSLVAVAFLFQFSEEVLANHKFLNIWLILANLFVAFGLWQLWTMRNRIAGKLAAVVLVALIATGGLIDLF
ncbi:MAG TPA: hypothetical protein VKB46_09975, partial [Pyrinomonadaceae bacterium]|nr:hypothetical protein [Pyrinomonadaceae bacterium]